MQVKAIMNTRLLIPSLRILFINFIIFALIPADITGLVGDVIYNLVRAFAVGYAGWIVTRRGDGRIRTSAISGLTLEAFDQVLLKGGKFLLDAVIFDESMTSAMDTFVGTIFAFVLWSPLPVVIAITGTMLGRWGRAKPAGQ